MQCRQMTRCPASAPARTGSQAGQRRNNGLPRFASDLSPPLHQNNGASSPRPPVTLRRSSVSIRPGWADCRSPATISSKATFGALAFMTAIARPANRWPMRVRGHWRRVLHRIAPVVRTARGCAQRLAGHLDDSGWKAMPRTVPFLYGHTGTGSVPGMMVSFGSAAA